MKSKFILGCLCVLMLYACGNSGSVNQAEYNSGYNAARELMYSMNTNGSSKYVDPEDYYSLSYGGEPHPDWVKGWKDAWRGN